MARLTVKGLVIEFAASEARELVESLTDGVAVVEKPIYLSEVRSLPKGHLAFEGWPYGETYRYVKEVGSISQAAIDIGISESGVRHRIKAFDGEFERNAARIKELQK